MRNEQSAAWRRGLLIAAAAALLGSGWYAGANFQSSAFSLVSSATAAEGRLPSKAAQRRTEIVEVAERLSPAIVSVGASKSGYVVSPFFDFFSDFMVFPYQERIPYLGSGVVIDPNGLIVTNQHVIEGATDVFVTLPDGRELSAKVLGADPVLDVALLEVNEKGLKSVKLGDSDDLMVGEWVIAMGNPFGNLIGDPKPTVTVGVISATKRSFRSAGPQGRVYEDVIQTDAAINPGNSGGALINAAGELIGMNTFIVSRSGGSIGLGFAIPVNRIRAVVEEILMYGRVRPRLTDFRVLNANERLARMVGARATEGAIISEIIRGGPGMRAGLRVGDIITAMDGKPVKGADDVRSIWARQVGTIVELTVDRAGRTLRVQYPVTEARE
ncbi:MAG: trypsin-like peptidase domain-containing protein [Candidatus Sumerlaeaceae bacterium]|nr:trypsin-like peptidase domain-containing protein [Candidatus Sumerlaeaceae bacterium]